MNEHVRRLVGQALDRAVPYTWHNLDHVEVEKIMKEFAELIVRECAGISEQHNRNYYKSHGQIIADKIKQHFGVES